MAKFVKGTKQKLGQRTVILLLIILVVGFGAVIARIAYLQLIKGEELSQRAVEQQLRDTEISAKRGTIYDRTGKVLAQSASVWRVVMAPAYFTDDKQREYVATNLAEILDLKYEDVLEETQQNSYYVTVKRKIESAERKKILKLMDTVEDKYDISSLIQLIDDYKRYYPYNDLASTVIGFTGDDDQGLEGIEYQYNKYLSGTSGRLVSAKNSQGTDMPFDYEQNIEAEDGNNLVLTIDENVQAICEKYMTQNLKDYGVYNRGCAIMMDVKNGEIIAMATVGGYDLNDPYTIFDSDVQKRVNSITNKKEKKEATSEAITEQWRNKAISDTYYPGSVFKIITSAMALEEGAIDADTSSFYCTGSMTIGDKEIHCHNTSGHGTQSFEQAIINSCNPAFMQIGAKVGEKKFWEYYQAFGLSELTGIDLPGESEDIFFSEDGSMSTVDLAVASFGQNFSITPIQMITAVAAVANGGDLVQPHIVKQIQDSDGNVIKTFDSNVKRKVVSSSVCETINTVLEHNSQENGVKGGYVSGYRVAGKTGTSEKKVDSNDDGEDDYIASFLGYAPADDPEYAMLIFFDTPTQGGYYGSVVSAPVFSSIMEEALPYLEVETEYSDDELDNLDVVAGTYVGLTSDEAVTQVESAGLTPVIKGSGDKVVGQMPESGSTVPNGGTLVLYTDEASAKETVEVPNLVGYSLSDVNSLISQYGLNLAVKGASTTEDALSTQQSLPEGTKVSEGTVITITFAAQTGIAD
jgi:stage V sporulation protein D (sporulation-specific penicillin-binding protein)